MEIPSLVVIIDVSRSWKANNYVRPIPARGDSNEDHFSNINKPKRKKNV